MTPDDITATLDDFTSALEQLEGMAFALAEAARARTGNRDEHIRDVVQLTETVEEMRRQRDDAIAECNAFEETVIKVARERDEARAALERAKQDADDWASAARSLTIQRNEAQAALERERMKLREAEARGWVEAIEAAERAARSARGVAEAGDFIRNLRR